MSKQFEELEVWQLSRILVKQVYLLTNKTSSLSKDYGFIDQIRRASISVMNNIAEGYERKTDKEFIQFLYIAKSSCGEVRSMLYIASDLEYIDKLQFDNLLEQTQRISKSLSGFIKYLNQSKPI
jgi:four helix bundle protein